MIIIAMTNNTSFKSPCQYLQVCSTLAAAKQQMLGTSLATALAAATNIITVGYVAANVAVGVVLGVLVREGGYVLPWGRAGKGTSWKGRRAEVCEVFSSPPCVPLARTPG